MEIVDNSGELVFDSKWMVEKIVLLFVEYLIVDFRYFMVYGLDFYKFCIERFVYKVIRVCV